MGELTRAERNAEWIEAHCIIPDGKLVGQPVKLTDKQREWLKLIYDDETRLFILSMARKNAKTAFIAMLLLLHVCGPEFRRNSRLYSAAQSREQASILYGYAASMVRMSRELSEYVVLRETAKEILCPELGTMYRALSADASTSYGLSPVMVVHDELGQVKGPKSELYEALETASAAQESPLSIVISTQAPTDGDLLSMLIDDANSGADPRNKAVVYKASDDCDPFELETIEQANPHLYDFMNVDEVLRMAENARRLPSREPEYRNLILNQRVDATNPLIPRSVWEANSGKPEPLKGKAVYAGLDLSEVKDLTALVLLSEDGDVHPTFWLPEEGLVERSRADRVPYDLWAKQGFLQTTPGKSIQYEFVAKYLYDLFQELNIVSLAFDRAYMRHLKPWLFHAGFSEKQFEDVFVDFGQGYLSMTPAIRSLEGVFLEGGYKHGNHPVLAMCAANAVTMSDPAGSRKFTKAKSSGRIDGMVSLAMAEAMRVEHEEMKDECVYNVRGIRTL